MAAEPVREPPRLVRIAADHRGEQALGSHQTGGRVIEVTGRSGIDRGRTCDPVQRQDPDRALRGRTGEGVRHGDLLEVPQREKHQRRRAVDRHELTDVDLPVPGQRGSVGDERDQQHARQQHLDRRDQRPHPRAAHGRLADLLRGAPVAAEEQLLAADAAQHAQPGHRVGSQLGGPARLLALDIGAAGGPGEQRQHGEGEQRHGERHEHAERGQIQDEPDADDDQGRGRGGEAGERLDEPADLLHVSGGHRDDLARGDPSGQRRAELGGLAGQQLLDPCGCGDPVGDGGAVKHGVAHRDQHAEHRDHAAGQGQPSAGPVDDRLDGESHGERQPRERALVQQTPGQGLELSADLVAAEPEQEARTRPDIGIAGIRVRKIANLHDVPKDRKELRSTGDLQKHVGEACGGDQTVQASPPAVAEANPFTVRARESTGAAGPGHGVKIGHASARPRRRGRPGTPMSASMDECV